MTSSTPAIETTTLTIEHRGKRIFVDALAGDHISSTIEASKAFYEWQLLGALAEYLEVGDYVVDVGANIGNHSLYFAAVCGADVLAFEPLPIAVEVLRRNIEQNFLDDHIEVRSKVLGEAGARAALSKFNRANVGATSFAISGDGEYCVSALDLEHIERTVALIKVDAEGMDLSVLRGAVGIITRDRPIIVCEAATQPELLELEGFVSEIGYAFTAQFNATPTYVLAPAGTAREKASVSRRAASLLTRTNLAARDLNYRLGLVNGDLRNIRDAQEAADSNPDLGQAGFAALAEMSARVRQLEALVEALDARLQAYEPKSKD